MTEGIYLRLAALLESLTPRQFAALYPELESLVSEMEAAREQTSLGYYLQKERLN